MGRPDITPQLAVALQQRCCLMGNREEEGAELLDEFLTAARREQFEALPRNAWKLPKPKDPSRLKSLDDAAGLQRGDELPRIGEQACLRKFQSRFAAFDLIDYVC